MIYKNYRSDFNVRVSFLRISDGETAAVPVPGHVRVEFKTHEKYQPFIVERDGASCSMCSLSSDGMALTAHLSLSRHMIGRGQLLADIVVITPDPAFPDRVKEAAMPVTFDAILYSGKSGDGDLSVDAWAGDDSDVSGLNRLLAGVNDKIAELQSGKLDKSALLRITEAEIDEITGVTGGGASATGGGTLIVPIADEYINSM